MEVLVISAAVGISVVWVYVDARGRDWSGTGYGHYSPGFWAFAVLAVWIVFFPAYLIVRRRAHPRSLRRCPRCAELVRRDAAICRFCRARLGGPAGR